MRTLTFFVPITFEMRVEFAVMLAVACAVSWTIFTVTSFLRVDDGDMATSYGCVHQPEAIARLARLHRARAGASDDEVLALAAQHECTWSSSVSDRGGWCLQASGEDFAPGRPLAQFHVPADPGVAAQLLVILNGSSVLDLGAGLGQYGAAWGDLVDYRARDGALNVEEFTKGLVCWADLSVPLGFVEPARDFVVSLEVGEHIPIEGEAAFLDNVAAKAKFCALVSWAVPGQGGHSHVNERTNEYVEAQMAARGFTRVFEMEKRVRAAAKYEWFRNTFMAFCR